MSILLGNTGVTFPDNSVQPSAAAPQINAFSATVAASALTISETQVSLAFRSTTLGSGAVTYVTGTPANLVVPSTATLGTVSAVQSRIIVLALNNAGAIELAVVNIAGGNDLTETGVISTTAISAGSTSASVVYSTTARTSVAYRVLGYIESTQATAGTWATAPSTVQGYGGQAMAAMSSFGFGFKNRLINGGMQIDQRNAGASVGAGYPVDRFFLELAQPSKLTAQQNAGSIVSATGFSNYLGITSSSAYAPLATDFFWIQQRIEGFNVSDLGWGTANAQPIVVSFRVYSSLTGTFSGSIANAANTRSYPFSYTVPSANTWNTIQLIILGDTAGTWVSDSGVGLRVSLNLGSGANYQGAANTWAGADYRGGVTGSVSVVGTSGATFYITGVQLEKGSVATSFDYRDFGRELILCQRYTFVPASVPTFALAWVVGAALIQGGAVSLPVTMRAAPTVSGITSYAIQGVTITATGFSLNASASFMNLSSTSSNGLADGVLRSCNPNQIPVISAEL